MKKLFASKHDLLVAVKNAVYVILGTVLLAFGFAVFLEPYKLVTGGITGLSIALAYVSESEFLTADVFVTIFTWSFFFVGLFVLGKSFALNTLISTIVYPPFFSLFMRLTEADLFGGILDMSSGEYAEIGIIVAAIFGGVVVGVGSALAYIGGGSTGGLDIAAFICAKFIPKIKSSTWIFIWDASVVVFGLFAIGDLVVCLLGVASALACAIFVDKVFLGGTQALIAHIVSEKHVEINNAIIDKLDRTSTVITAKGGYTGADKPMIMVSFTKSQYPAFMRIISSIDREAFVTVHQAREINGEGWTKHDLDTAANEEADRAHKLIVEGALNHGSDNTENQ